MAREALIQLATFALTKLMQETNFLEEAAAGKKREEDGRVRQFMILKESFWRDYLIPQRPIESLQYCQLNAIPRRLDFLGVYTNFGELGISTRSTSSSDRMLQGLKENEEQQVNKQLIIKVGRRRPVISVVGLGDIGRTTLAKKVYNHINVVDPYFGELRDWVYVSRDCKPIDIYRKILDQLVAGEEEVEADRRIMKEFDQNQQMEGKNAEDENFVVVVVRDDQSPSSDLSSTKFRWQSIHSSDFEFERYAYVEHSTPCLGSFIFVFSKLDGGTTSAVLSDVRFIPKCFKRLRELDLEGLEITNLPNKFGELIFLKYWGIRNTGLQTLPSSIKGLWNLRTLETNYYLKEVPKQISEVKNLRDLCMNRQTEPKEIQAIGKLYCHGNTISHLNVLQISELTRSSMLNIESGAMPWLTELQFCQQLHISKLRDGDRTYINHTKRCRLYRDQGETTPSPGQTLPSPSQTSPIQGQTSATIHQTSQRPLQTSTRPGQTSQSPRQISPSPSQTSQSSSQTTTSSSQISPKRGKISPSPFQTSTSPDQTLPSSGQTSLSQGQKPPSSDQISQSPFQTSTSLGQTSLNLGQTPPSPDQTSLSPIQTSTSPRQTPPIPSQTSPSLVQTSPSSYQTSLSPIQTSTSPRQTPPIPSQTSPSLVQTSPSSYQTSLSPFQMSTTLGQISRSLDQTSISPSQTPPSPGQTSTSPSQTSTSPSQTLLSPIQISTSSCQISPSLSQTSLSSFQTSPSLGQTSLGLIQTSTSPSQTPQSLGQTSSCLFQTSTSLGRTSPSSCQTLTSLGQTASSPGQTPPILGQTSVSRSQTSPDQLSSSSSKLIKKRKRCIGCCCCFLHGGKKGSSSFSKSNFLKRGTIQVKRLFDELKRMQYFLETCQSKAKRR